MNQHYCTCGRHRDNQCSLCREFINARDADEINWVKSGVRTNRRAVKRRRAARIRTQTKCDVCGNVPE